MAQLFSKAPPAYSFRIADRDEAGGRALTELHDRGIADVARVMAQSADHVLSFFEMLRLELAFYIGCLNLHERLQTLGVATCMPIAQVADCADPLNPVELAEHAHQSWHGLRDPSLALTLQSATVANDGNAGARQLIVITGANQGGKSTLLRALGQAQLMLHAGMFVAAESYIAPLRSGVFTHYKREEDATMQSGKFDEELIRMSAIANTIRPGAVLLFNEPFASTNEREGSEIMLQVIDALRERGIAVWLVTHLVSGARTLYQRGSSDALFLRAERRDDGVRSFRLVEGEPLQTSFGEDLYRQVFSPQTREALSNAIVQN